MFIEFMTFMGGVGLAVVLVGLGQPGAAAICLSIWWTGGLVLERLRRSDRR